MLGNTTACFGGRNPNEDYALYCGSQDNESPGTTYTEDMLRQLAIKDCGVIEQEQCPHAARISFATS